MLRRTIRKDGLALGEFAAEILIGTGSGDAAARSAIEHADLHEIRLVHFLDGVFFFAEGRGERAEAYGTTAVFIDKRDHQVAVNFVEAVFIDADHVQELLERLRG